MRVNRKKLLKFIVTGLITIIIFAILFTRIKFFEVTEVLKQTDINLLCLSMLISLIAHIFFSTGRYREILKVLGRRLSFFETVVLRMGSIPIKSLLPFKVGELSRAAYLKKTHNLSYLKGVSSILLGYVLSLFTLLLFIFVGCYFYHLTAPQRIYLLLLFSAFLLLMLLLREGIIHRFFKKSLKRLYQGQGIFKVLAGECSIKSIFILLLYSLGFEGCKLLNTLLLLRAINVEIPCGTFLRFAPLTILASTLPITFLGLGTRESAIPLLFSGYGTPEKLLGGSLLISFANRLFPILLGLFFMKPFLNGLLSINKEGEALDEPKVSC